MIEVKKQFEFYLYNKPTLVIIDWYNIYNKNRNIDLQIFFDYLKSYDEIYQIIFYNGTIMSEPWSYEVIKTAQTIGYKVVTKNSKYIKIDITKEDHLKSIMNSLQKLLDSVSDKNSDIANKIYSVIKKVEDGSDIEIYDLIQEIDLDLKELNINIDEFRKQINQPIKKIKCDFDAEIARDIILDINNFDNLILFSGDGDFASTVKYLVEERAKKVFVIYPQGSFGEPDYKNIGLISFDNSSKKRLYKNGFICRPIEHLVSNFVKKNPQIALRDPI